MAYPHNYDPKRSPPIYLYRDYVSKRPNQITFCAMVGSFRMHVVDISAYLNHFVALDEGTEAVIKQRILADKENQITRIYGDIKQFILVVGERPIAKFSTAGDCIGAAEDFVLVPIHAGARVAGDDCDLRIIENDDTVS